MMEIEENTLARVYSFDLKFKGGNKTQFYRELFGFNSKTSREDSEGRKKVYENFYPGLLTPIPHLRLGKSVIAVPKNAETEFREFFEDSRWGDIDLYAFDGVLPNGDRMRAMEEVLERIKIGTEASLNSEIDFLLELVYRGDFNSDYIGRAMRVLEKCEELIEHDWTDDYKFSEKLNERLDPLRSEVG